MRRVVLAVVGTITGLIMLLSFKTHAGTSAAPEAPSTAGNDATGAGDGSATTPPAAATPASPTSGGPTKTVTGNESDTRYGPVQVQVTVTNGFGLSATSDASVTIDPTPTGSPAVTPATATVGAGQVNGATTAMMGAEDFAFMLEAKPGAYIFIGNGGEPGGACHSVHTPLYDFNDEIIGTGVDYWCNLGRREPLGVQQC